MMMLMKRGKVNLDVGVIVLLWWQLLFLRCDSLVRNAAMFVNDHLKILSPNEEA